MAPTWENEEEMACIEVWKFNTMQNVSTHSQWLRMNTNWHHSSQHTKYARTVRLILFLCVDMQDCQISDDSSELEPFHPSQELSEWLQKLG